MSYDFDTLMNEAYESLEKTTNNTHLILPKIIYETTVTRIHWRNVIDYLKIIKRQPDHFISFIKAEYPDKEISWFSNSISDGIIIHGKFLKQQLLHDFAMKYINVYVICSACKSADTELTKLSSKMYSFECLDCGHNKNM
jgi:translation initiation factor 2 beta subunit (eIF-2beta)/eIF-5